MKRANISARDRLRSANNRIEFLEARLQIAKQNNQHLSNLIAAIVSEAEGEVRISKKLYQDPDYESVQIITDEEELIIMGLPVQSSPEMEEGEKDAAVGEPNLAQ